MIVLVIIQQLLIVALCFKDEIFGIIRSKK